MLEVEKKLGRRLAGRTTKAGSLQRIAAYLVSMNVFEAAPEQETMIVTTKVPMLSRFRTALVSAVLLLVLAGGAGGYYVWMKSKETPAQYPVIQPVMPSTGTSLITRPQQTTSVAPGTAQDSAVSSLSTTRSAPSVSAVSSSVSATQSASVPTSVSAQQKKEDIPQTRKKTAKSKKKKVSSEQ
jgi:hypothetical protein